MSCRSLPKDFGFDSKWDEKSLEGLKQSDVISLKFKQDRVGCCVENSE